MVRGLDYYTKTAFEVKSNSLGAQNAIAGGGRYNGLGQFSGRTGSCRESDLASALNVLYACLPEDGKNKFKTDLFIAALGAPAQKIRFQPYQRTAARRIWPRRWIMRIKA